MKSILIILSILFCLNYSFAQSNQISNINVELGIPNDSNDIDDFIISIPQYVSSFNCSLHITNWVSWNINKEWFGDAPRYTRFLQDPTVYITNIFALYIFCSFTRHFWCQPILFH